MKYPLKLTLRLLIAVFLGVFYKLFYIVFTPITLYPVYGLVKLMTPAALSGTMLYLEGYAFNFVDACAAASAYLLLSFLILLTMDISWKKRIAMFVAGSGLIWAFNILRILLLFVILLNYGLSAFAAVHMFIWKFLASVYVFLVWVFIIRAFKIKTIPVYSDLKYLMGKIRKKEVRKVVKKRVRKKVKKRVKKKKKVKKRKRVKRR